MVWCPWSLAATAWKKGLQRTGRPTELAGEVTSTESPPDEDSSLRSPAVSHGDQSQLTQRRPLGMCLWVS